MQHIKKLTDHLQELYTRKSVDEKTYKILQGFIESYVNTALEGKTPLELIIKILGKYLDHLDYLHNHPFVFEPYHLQVKDPFDYYQFGIDFIKPLINHNVSQYKGQENLKNIDAHLKQNHNVILLANHQTEVDPHFIEFMIEKDYPSRAKEMIFVAGDRVILDQLAIPVSMGRNLLCIYSKKHISNPPSQMEKKRLHNKKTMELMGQLLKEGGKCIYVAPSGGRDRPDENGNFPIAPLDAQSIELFHIMAQRSKVPTHFHSLALLTHRVFPPPNNVGVEIGEERRTSYSGIYGYFGSEIDMFNFAGHTIENKIERRHARSDFIWNQINQDYQSLLKLQDQYE